jgi:hypothetical protein
MFFEKTMVNKFTINPGSESTPVLCKLEKTGQPKIPEIKPHPGGYEKPPWKIACNSFGSVRTVLGPLACAQNGLSLFQVYGSGQIFSYGNVTLFKM